MGRNPNVVQSLDSKLGLIFIPILSPEKVTAIKPENLEYQIVPADKDGESKTVDVDKIKRKENLQRIITYAIKTNAKQSETNKVSSASFRAAIN